VVSQSPIDKLLGAIDKLDVEAAMALMAPDCRLLTADGRRAEGTGAVRGLLTDFLARLRSATHRITAQWHQDDVWIAEVEANYELTDWMKTGTLPRVFVLRQGPAGLTAVHAYGAHEQPLSEYRTGEEGMRIGGRWLPPL
jgi:SnoaL-like domain